MDRANGTAGHDTDWRGRDMPNAIARNFPITTLGAAALLPMTA
jgi:hypothetical protein